MVHVTGRAVCSRLVRSVARLAVLDTWDVDVGRQPAGLNRGVTRRAVRLDDMRGVVEQRPFHEIVPALTRALQGAKSDRIPARG